MRKTSARKKNAIPRDGMRAQYRFNYSKAKPNRFAEEMRGRTIAVVLEPDVAEIFKSSDDVNALLRSVISALPERKHGQTR